MPLGQRSAPLRSTIHFDHLAKPMYIWVSKNPIQRSSARLRLYA